MARRSQPFQIDASLTCVRALLRLTRPQQWIKNAVVLAGLVFAEVTDQPRAVADASMAVLAFLLASSAIYVFNDLQDVEGDRRHPLKQNRPIASGAVGFKVARWFCGTLVVAAVAFSLAVSWSFLGIVTAYVVTMCLYTLALKRIAILDVVVIALGFVMRAVGGAVAVDVPISSWLLVCAFLLALFLGFGKRRSEVVMLGESAVHHRQSLDGYTRPLLDQLVGISAVSALVSYAVYTLDASSVPESGVMVFTVPFVAFAIFRYLYLVYGKNLGGSPESLLYRDRWLLASVVVWGALALVLMESGS